MGRLRTQVQCTGPLCIIWVYVLAGVAGLVCFGLCVCRWYQQRKSREQRQNWEQFGQHGQPMAIRGPANPLQAQWEASMQQRQQQQQQQQQQWGQQQQQQWGQ